MDRTLIVGLGNPGPRYQGTRHNIGFDVLESIASEARIPLGREKFKGRYGTGELAGNPVVLLTPLTFMNRSGESVAPAMKFFQIPLSRVIVVHDELEFPFERLRLKQGGGHAGHNGLRSIIERCGGRDFLRLRVGIGRPKHGAVADYVLAPFSAEERPFVAPLAERGAGAVQLLLREGLSAAMNQLHGEDKGARKKGSSASP